ncbi:MAG TPA: IPT/TIG domain-containing protein [Gammaproteobacteria bacterium]|jgi:hypothetical protein
MLVPGIAAAADCSASGTLSIKLAPCPLSKQLKGGAGTPLAVNASVAVNASISGGIAIVIGDSAHVLDSSTLSLIQTGPTTFTLRFDSNPSLVVGTHTGRITIKVCSDTSCRTTYVSVDLPYTLTVVSPPKLSKLTPASATAEGAKFTLKVSGSSFKAGDRIRFGSTYLATTINSGTLLSAVVDAPGMRAGKTVEISVVDTAGFQSNSLAFSLKNPIPTLTSVSPASGKLGAAPFTLTARGSKFTTTSVLMMDGVALATEFVSPHELTARVNLSSATAGALRDITVHTPTPAGGTSGAQVFEVDNLAPSVSGLSPSSVTAGSGGFTLKILGTQFEAGSVITVGGASLTPGAVSAQELDVSVPASMIQAGSDLPVVVTTAAPGGGVSSPVQLVVSNPAPTVTLMSPLHAEAGGGDMRIMVEGSNFNSSTMLEWDGTPLQTLSQTSTLLTAMLPAADLATPGTGTLALVAPAPGGGEVDKSFSVSIQRPAISSLSPGSAVPGASDFTLTVQGSHFDPAATVYWDGNALSTSFVSDTELQADVPAADVASAEVATVDVLNPPETGGVSRHATFAVATGGTAVMELSQGLDDIAWDPLNFTLYGADTATAVTDPHSIVAIDPVTLAIQDAVDTTESPTHLSVSNGSEFLYAGFNGTGSGGSIHRFTLPALTDDLSAPLGTNFLGAIVPGALEASPVYPHVFATTFNDTCCSPRNQGVGVYLDGVSHPVLTASIWDALAWSMDGTKLYGGDNESTAASFMQVPVIVTQSGKEQTTESIWIGPRMHVDAGTGLVYGDSTFNIIDPTSSTVTGTFPFPARGAMIPDSSLGCAYILYRANQSGFNYTLSCYDLASQTLVRSLALSGLNGAPVKVVRWGNEGLAFYTDAGALYVISGKIVTGN